MMGLTKPVAENSGIIEEDEEEEDATEGFEKLAGAHRNAYMQRASEYQAQLPSSLGLKSDGNGLRKSSGDEMQFMGINPKQLKPRTNTAVGLGLFSKLGRKTHDASKIKE